MLDDDGPPQIVAMPDGCRFAAVGAGRLLFDCSPPGGMVVRGQTLDLATGVDLLLDGRRATLPSTLALSAVALTGMHVLARDERGRVVSRRLPGGGGRGRP